MTKVIKAASIDRLAQSNFGDRLTAIEKEIIKINLILIRLQSGIAEAGSKVPLQAVFTFEDVEGIE
jgi:hypothetical protein